MKEEDIPLKILICDPVPATALLIRDLLVRQQSVRRVNVAGSIQEAQVEIRGADVNTILIDVESLGIKAASEFVFSVRRALPEIVFVLYIDVAFVESRRDVFYAGERRRFSHYYVLDKKTPLATLADEVQALIWRCRSDLSWRLSEASLTRLAEEVRALPTNTQNHDSEPLAAQLEKLVSAMTAERKPRILPRSVFLSYRFEEGEWIEGLQGLLVDNGFTIVDGKGSNSFIGQGILEKIQEAEFFLCLMTRSKRKEDGLYTTSPWLLEEKGAALALHKRIVLMIEEGVDEYGGLQGDWQRIHFAPKGFTTAALSAVKQLRSYVGG